MATNLRPPPLRDLDHNSSIWQSWYRDLQALLTSATGLIGWSSISKTGSNLTDLTTRNHADLQNINTAAYTHLTSTEYAAFARDDNVTSVAVNTAMDDTNRTVLVTASAKTITLPAASADRIGKDWTVILGTAGYVDIARAGSDTLTLPETEITIRLDNKGASVTLRCLTASSWGLA